MINLDKLKKVPLFIYIVIIPMIVVALYYAFFAVDRYVSISKVVVRQPQDGQAANIPSLALLMGGTNPTSREETLFLQEFVQSKDMMDYLQREFNWIQAYSTQNTDPLYFISEDEPAEDLLKFYNRIVTVHFDVQTGLLEIEVQAPTAQLAENMIGGILKESERFVNEISHKIARDQMKFFEVELGNAKRNYEEKKKDLIAFQSVNNLLDANAVAQSRSEIIAGLETLLTTERAHLKALLSALNSSSPQVQQQRTKIRAIEQQLDSEKKHLVSAADGDRLNVIASRFQNLTIDAGIAEESYKLAVTALENARIEASKKIRSLVTVVSPNLAQRAIYPDRLYNLATLFVLLLLLYGVARFVIATIEDHRD
ncbi:ABC transporter permease [Bordetella genomosp. 2]|uniref:ABC transporter permease n=1 Tax=Bordetella genomosp. 2 TaxID=1983456 RepID=A0A261VRR3_9BORD|nr:ABC transporter permease [Bordetella genomosp. 2]OZI76739.1 ABC transporter permease [Bordetella genomosp. 2]